MPRGPFDLIVASGILYYLQPNDLRTLIRQIYGALAPGGRVVVLHHLKDFSDAAVRPRVAQHTAVAAFRRRMPQAFVLDAGRFQVAALVKRNSPQRPSASQA